MSDSVRWENLRLLGTQDEVKFVISDRTDYDWVKAVINRESLAGRCPLLLSPVHGELDPQELAGWILADRLPARLQLQLHKIIWGEERGR